MKRISKNIVVYLLLTIFVSSISNAQDLEPRAYIKIPIKATILITGLIYSTGDVITDATLPLKNLKANVTTTSVAIAHSFSLFGLTAQAFAAIPFCYAKASADVNGQLQTIDRTGTADMRLRISALLLGAPAKTFKDFIKDNKPRTILGTSLTIQPPTGQYFPDKLINLGTHRWAFKPELALSQPFGKRWLVDVYTGVWLFTDNNSFFTGTALRSQHPIGALQTHASYTIKPNMWAAFDATYYVGGNSTVNGVAKDDRVSNFRMGATVVLPTGKRSGLKFSFSKGVVVARGTDFATFTLGWTYSWF